MRVAAIALVALGLQAIPPQVTQVQEWFEAGRYQQIVDVASQTSDPLTKYLVASSHDRLGQFEDARRVYSELAALGDADPWAWIGRSANALVTSNAESPLPDALASAQEGAQQAVTMLTADPQNPALAFAQYQLGSVHAYGMDYVNAAAAFDQAAELAPSFAYAHYYAGLAYSNIERTDQMAIRFERFLRLAPRAPEASLVQSLMSSSGSIPVGSTRSTVPVSTS